MREHWTLDPELLYLNHGSFGAVPRVAQEAQSRLQATAEGNPMRWFRELPGRLVSARELIGRALGVGGGDIAFIANATTGVNLALRSVATAPGQRFVLSSHAYGAVQLAARRIAAERDCEVVVLDVPLDASDDEVVASFEAAVDERSGCVVVDQITSATAKMLPVERVVALCRDRGVPVVVDGAHAPALVDRPVVGDFWTGNLHKWPCAPRGTGVLYVAPERRQDVVPPVLSWGESLGFPLSFDLPGTMDATGWLAAASAWSLLDSLGFADRRKQLGETAATGAEVLADAVGGRVVDVGSPAPTMRLLTLPAGLVTDDAAGLRLAAYLSSRTGVEIAVTSWRGQGFLRVSAHLYNTPADYEAAAGRFARLFADADEMFRSNRI